MRNVVFSLTILAIAPAAGLSGPGGGQSPTSVSTSHFVILRHGVQIGTDSVTLSRTATEWIISSNGRQDPPIDLVTKKFEMTYAPDWQPVRLSIDATLAGKPLRISTSFGLTTAISDVTQGDRDGTTTQVVSARTVVAPANFYAAYEALAARLGTAAVGAHVPIYIVPQGEVTATVDRITPHRIAAPGVAEDLRQFDLTLAAESTSVSLEIWTDAANRLARLAVPNTSTIVIRDDLSSAMAREQVGHRAGDEQVFIPSERFNLGATVSKPGVEGAKRPAVVLVAGSGTQDRELVVAGVPIFSGLAGALADAGFVVARYDRRGLGHSGGRIESSSLAELADDASHVADWMRRRKDVDEDRIAMIGYGDGGAVALLAAIRDKHTAAVVLLAAPGMTGREAVLDQQRRALARQPGSEADKQEKIALQSTILDAVISGLGWDALAPAVRESADTPLFKSWLLFDPAIVIPKLDKPLLILQGSLDEETAPSNADRLEELGRRRAKSAAGNTQKIIVPGVNHLLAQARTGQVDEYASLDAKQIAPQVADAVVGWLKDTMNKK